VDGERCSEALEKGEGSRSCSLRELLVNKVCPSTRERRRRQGDAFHENCQLIKPAKVDG
jgi:hypothetical protein